MEAVDIIRVLVEKPGCSLKHDDLIFITTCRFCNGYMHSDEYDSQIDNFPHEDNCPIVLGRKYLIEHDNHRSATKITADNRPWEHG